MVVWRSLRILHKNMQQTMLFNFSRWKSAIPALRLFIENWALNYCIALVIHQAEWGDQVTMYANSLLGHMNTASGLPGTANDNEKYCPPLYAQGLLVLGFADAYYTDHVDWLSRNDPFFGPDSHGNTARDYIIRVFMMDKGLNDLIEAEKQGTLRDHPAFALYYDVVENSMPDL